MGYFGINRFDTLDEAFEEMVGEYGEHVYGFDHMMILNDYEFQRVVVRHMLFALLNKEQWVENLGKDDMVSDMFLNFNFILKSERLGYVYTGIETMKDDGVTEPDEEQWEYIFELYEVYNILDLRNFAVDFFKRNNVEDFDTLWDISVDNHLLPFGEDDTIHPIFLDYVSTENKYLS